MGAFYLDENVSRLVAAELELVGQVVTTTAGERRFGAPDPQQLLYAGERNWTIITHNRHDFRLLHDAWLLWSYQWGKRQPHAGILVLDFYRGQSPSDVAGTIAALLADPATSLDTALYDWKRSTGWTRFPG